MRVRLIIGLPGSGKTSLAKKWQAEGEAVVVLDDTRDHQHWPDCQELILIDTRLCLKKDRRHVKQMLGKRYPGCVIEETYFANDINACRENIARRAYGDNVEPELILMHRLYRPKDGFIPVWRAGVGA